MVSDLTPATAVLSAGFVFVAYFIRGIAGFGSGLIAIPLLALLLPLPLVVPAVAVTDYLAFHFEQERKRNYPGPPIPAAASHAA